MYDDDADDIADSLTIEELPAPVSAFAHVSHATAPEHLVPGHPSGHEQEYSSVAAEAAHLYRRH